MKTVGELKAELDKWPDNTPITGATYDRDGDSYPSTLEIEWRFTDEQGDLWRYDEDHRPRVGILWIG